MSGKRMNHQMSPIGSPLSGNDVSDTSSKDQDRFLPIANVSRIMKKSLPANAKISKEAKETVQECVSEFISFITGEASDKCQREKRKTINGDDLLWAMTTLGFENYVGTLKGYLNKYREIEGEKNSFGARQDDTSPIHNHNHNNNNHSYSYSGEMNKINGGSFSSSGDQTLYSFGAQTVPAKNYVENSRFIGFGDSFVGGGGARMRENGDEYGSRFAAAAQLQAGLSGSG